MVSPVVSALLATPRAADPPKRVWRDWALVGVLVPTAILEGLLREQLVWRPVATVIMATLTLTLLWRRTHPLAMMVLGFGVPNGVDAVTRIVEGNPVEFYTTIFVLLLPYALCRWGSGREIAVDDGPATASAAVAVPPATRRISSRARRSSATCSSRRSYG